MRIVDDRTGQVVQQIRKNQDVYRPVWLKAEKDYEYVDEKTGQTVHVKKDEYINYEGYKLPMERRIPKWDEARGRFVVEKLTWDDFKKEAEERNQGRPKE